MRATSHGPGRGSIFTVCLPLARSAFARSEDRRLAFESGTQGYVTKPVDPVDLIKAIHAVTGEPERG